jgi:hypothetical protein
MKLEPGIILLQFVAYCILHIVRSELRTVALLKMPAYNIVVIDRQVTCWERF